MLEIKTKNYIKYFWAQQAAKSQQNQRYSCFSKDLPLLRLAATRVCLELIPGSGN